MLRYMRLRRRLLSRAGIADGRSETWVQQHVFGRGK